LGIKTVAKIEIAKNVVGHHMKVNIKKNKVGFPGVDIMVPLIYGIGISPEWEIMETAVAKGVIKKSGSWYSYDDAKIAQGQWNTFTFLTDNSEFTDEIKSKLNESTS
jgi:recombination protein RecA